MQGRSLKNGEITQEITDLSRIYRLLGSDKYAQQSRNSNIYTYQIIRICIDFLFLFARVVALESQLVRAGSLTQEDGHDLHILAGHEASY